MSGNITFVGAGPGAVDLITVRGAAVLAAADAVIYAGSLVNEQLLDLAMHAKLYNSAKLALPEVLAIMTEHYRKGDKVVRLHTGDPAMYGAVSEQYRELDRLNIPFDVVPGVSSVFAAAAALKVELTMPGLSQSVILTREAGKTPVPEREDIGKLAAHGTTLCLFLSVGDLAQLCGRLIAAGRNFDTPAAVVYRASWDNEIIVRGTLSDIAVKTEAAGVKRQSMIIVGDVLRRDGELSKLYDQNFATGFRRLGAQDFGGKVALFALTRQALYKAAEIAAGLHDATLFVPAKYVESAPSIRAKFYNDGEFGTAFARAWDQYDGFVMVMAAGIAVRHAAKFLSDKKTDPAVVVCDELGNYAVSLLSGHVGGGNLLAANAARITGGKAVITTASDVNCLPSPDLFAKQHYYKIVNASALTAVAAAIVNGESVKLAMPRRLFDRHFARFEQFIYQEPADLLTVTMTVGDTVLTLKKRKLTLGVGCRRHVSEVKIAETVLAVLEANGLSLSDITLLATADVKRDEAGLLQFAQNNHKELRFFAADELNQVPVPHPSAAAQKYLNLNSVAEAAALLAAGPGAELAVAKTAGQSVTVAVAQGGVL